MELSSFKVQEGQVFGVLSKSLSRRPVLHLRVSEFKSHLSCPVQFLANTQPARYQVMGRGLAFVSSTQETWLEFQVFGFVLTQLQLLQALRSKPAGGRADRLLVSLPFK